MNVLATEYGLLGLVSFLALSGMIYMFKQYHESQKERLKEHQNHSSELLDFLVKMLNSNNALKESITNGNFTNKSDILKAIEDSKGEVSQRIQELTNEVLKR